MFVIKPSSMLDQTIQCEVLYDLIWVPQTEHDNSKHSQRLESFQKCINIKQGAYIVGYNTVGCHKLSLVLLKKNVSLFCVTYLKKMSEINEFRLLEKNCVTFKKKWVKLMISSLDAIIPFGDTFLAIT